MKSGLKVHYRLMFYWICWGSNLCRDEKRTERRIALLNRDERPSSNLCRDEKRTERENTTSEIGIGGRSNLCRDEKRTERAKLMAWDNLETA